MLDTLDELLDHDASQKNLAEQPSFLGPPAAGKIAISIKVIGRGAEPRDKGSS